MLLLSDIIVPKFHVYSGYIFDSVHRFGKLTESSELFTSNLFACAIDPKTNRSVPVEMGVWAEIQGVNIRHTIRRTTISFNCGPENEPMDMESLALLMDITVSPARAPALTTVIRVLPAILAVGATCMVVSGKLKKDTVNTDAVFGILDSILTTYSSLSSSHEPLGESCSHHFHHFIRGLIVLPERIIILTSIITKVCRVVLQLLPTDRQ